jgi:hypothetical protein
MILTKEISLYSKTKMVTIKEINDKRNEKTNERKTNTAIY